MDIYSTVETRRSSTAVIASQEMHVVDPITAPSSLFILLQLQFLGRRTMLLP